MPCDAATQPLPEMEQRFGPVCSQRLKLDLSSVPCQAGGRRAGGGRSGPAGQGMGFCRLGRSLGGPGSQLGILVRGAGEQPTQTLPRLPRWLCGATGEQHAQGSGKEGTWQPEAIGAVWGVGSGEVQIPEFCLQRAEDPFPRLSAARDSPPSWRSTVVPALKCQPMGMV